MIDERTLTRSTLVASQLPLEMWHGAIADPTLADAILDRLIHNAHKIHLKGESMRKMKSPKARRRCRRRRSELHLHTNTSAACGLRSVPGQFVPNTLVSLRRNAGQLRPIPVVSSAGIRIRVT